MRKFSCRRATLLFVNLASLYVCDHQMAQANTTAHNNHPFSIRMPYAIWAAGDVVSTSSRTAYVMVDAPASGKGAVLECSDLKEPAVEVSAEPGGARLRLGKIDLGRLSWGMILAPAKVVDSSTPTLVGLSPAATEGGRDARDPSSDAPALIDLPITFEKPGEAGCPTVWSGEALHAGLRLAVELRTFPGGFVDVAARLVNESAANEKVYCSVVTKWESAAAEGAGERTICYDYRQSPFPDGSVSFYRNATERNWHVQHGVDWILTPLKSGGSVAWLNDFAESFTVKRKVRRTSPKEKWVTGSSSHLGHEAVSKDGALYLITEIARKNIKSYADRVAENTLPMRGEAAEFESRLVVSEKAVSPDFTDNQFVAYNSYYTSNQLSAWRELTIGVKHVQFGTAYFPYSTLGENFDRLKLPGMDRDGFWPLAADTVNQWRLFEDDIKRDMRIIKAMGFEVVRLHHLELILALDEKVRNEYMDFLFGQLKELELKALVDIISGPQTIADIVSRYRAQIHAVEIDNEVLIWGIESDAPLKWRAIYDAVKAVAPEIPVHLTGYTNMGMFTRLLREGAMTDKIGAHSYIDAVESIPSGRGWGLSVGNFAAKVQKPPVITEWNWRQLTRMLPQERAKLYKDIIGNAIKTRSIVEFDQFQFNESLCPNPRIGRGNILRHYELLNLSRNPKPEAFELMKLMKEYRAPKPLEVTWGQAVAEGGKARATVKLANTSGKELKLNVETEAFGGVELDLADGKQSALTLAPDAKAEIAVNSNITTGTPGFYYGFLRMTDDAGKINGYGWVQVRQTGVPTFAFDMQSTVTYAGGVKEAVGLDYTKPIIVAYGAKSTVLEAEAAIAIAFTLESATGQFINALSEETITPEQMKSAQIIAVGQAKTCAIVAKALGSNDQFKKTPGSLEFQHSVVTRVKSPLGGSGDWMICTGATPQLVSDAALDFAVRYWVNAKDSAARRVGLVEKALAKKGPDPAALP